MWQARGKRWIIPVSILLVFIYGCGYRFLGQNISDTQSKKIAVPTFYNDTFEPLIGKKITGFIKEELVSNGGLRVVNDPSMADLTLTGRVTNYSLIPISFTEDNRVREYRVSIIIDIYFTGKTDNPEQKEKGNIWTEKGRGVTAEFLTTDDISANRAAEDRAIEEAAKLFAEDIVTQILESL